MVQIGVWKRIMAYVHKNARTFASVSERMMTTSTRNKQSSRTLNTSKIGKNHRNTGNNEITCNLG